jgi:hypothetical protein
MKNVHSGRHNGMQIQANTIIEIHMSLLNQNIMRFMNINANLFTHPRDWCILRPKLGEIREPLFFAPKVDGVLLVTCNSLG